MYNNEGSLANLPFCLQLGPVEGVIFGDYGTDLGSGGAVPGMSSIVHYPGVFMNVFLFETRVENYAMVLLRTMFKDGSDHNVPAKNH